jgi:hypothetical protein
VKDVSKGYLPWLYSCCVQVGADLNRGTTDQIHGHASLYDWSPKLGVWLLLVSLFSGLEIPPLHKKIASISCTMYIHHVNACQDHDWIDIILNIAF